MAHRRLATRAPATPPYPTTHHPPPPQQRTDIIFLSRRGAVTEPLLALRASGRRPVVISGGVFLFIFLLRSDASLGRVSFRTACELAAADHKFYFAAASSG